MSHTRHRRLKRSVTHYKTITAGTFAALKRAEGRWVKSGWVVTKPAHMLDDGRYSLNLELPKINPVSKLDLDRQN